MKFFSLFCAMALLLVLCAVQPASANGFRAAVVVADPCVTTVGASFTQFTTGFGFPVAVATPRFFGGFSFGSGAAVFQSRRGLFGQRGETVIQTGNGTFIESRRGLLGLQRSTTFIGR